MKSIVYSCKKNTADVLAAHQRLFDRSTVESPNYSFDYTDEFLNCQSSVVSSEVDCRFLPKKHDSQLLSFVYDYLGLSSRAFRVSNCGSFLEFGVFKDANKLLFANFCKDRLCPMCNWRRSLKLYGQVSACMNELERQGYRFIFLTLTIKNCSASALPKTVSVLLDGFTKLFHDNRRIKKACFGFFRSLEITKNSVTGEYHPHLHCIVAVLPSYFHKSYISQREWSSIWQNCIDVDYNPVIDVRAIRASDAGDQSEANFSSAVREVAKYSVKGSDFLNADDIDSTAETTLDFLMALSFRRLCSFTGVFSKVRKQLRFDDAENGDLVHTDIEELRSDVAIAIIRFGFKNGCYTLLADAKGGDCIA